MLCDRCKCTLVDVILWLDFDRLLYSVMCDSCTLAFSSAGNIDFSRCLPFAGGDVSTVAPIVERYRQGGFSPGLCPGEGHGEPQTHT